MPVSPKIVCFRFLKKFKKVKLCLDGKLQYKPIKDVEFTLACNGNANCISVTRLDIKLSCVPRQNCKCQVLPSVSCIQDVLGMIKSFATARWYETCTDGGFSPDAQIAGGMGGDLIKQL